MRGFPNKIRKTGLSRIGLVWYTQTVRELVFKGQEERRTRKSNSMASIRASMMANQEGRSPGSKFAMGHEVGRYVDLMSEAYGRHARTFALCVFLQHSRIAVATKRSSKRSKIAAATTAAPPIAAPPPGEAGACGDVQQLVYRAKTPPPELNDDIVMKIVALVYDGTTLADFLRCMMRSMVVTSVEDLWSTMAAGPPAWFYTGQTVRFGFPSFGVTDRGYEVGEKCWPYQKSEYKDETLQLTFSQRVSDDADGNARHVTWTLYVALDQVFLVDVKHEQVIPATAVKLETNVASHAGHLGLTPVQVAQMLSYKLRATVTHSWSRIRFEAVGTDKDARLGFVWDVKAEWLANRQVRLWADIAVGMRVRVDKPASKYAVAATGQVGTVVEIRWLKIVPTYYVQLEDAERTKMVELVNGSKKYSNEMTVGQLAGQVSCRRFQIVAV